MRGQAGMPSIDEAARDYGGVSLDDSRIVFVHLLLYGFDDEAPSLADAREWAEHYGIDERPNHVVLVGDPGMINPALLPFPASHSPSCRSTSPSS